LTNMGTYYESVLPLNFLAENETQAYPYIEVYLNPDLVYNVGYS